MDEYGMEEDVDLVFREQADGRKVSRLPSGKVVLVDLDELKKIHDGERWLVRILHRDTFAIARPLDKLAPAPTPKPGAGGNGATLAPAHPAVVETLPFRPRPIVAAPTPAPVALAPALVPKTEAVVKEVRGVRDLATPRHLIGETDRVALFVDAANMDQACRAAGYFVDYEKVIRYFRGRGVLYGGYYHVADFTQEEDSTQVRFLDYLNHAGYVVRPKKVKRIIDRETGEERFKANVDAELIIDMLNTADNYDVVFLFSGDSDYERLVDILRSRGKRIYVVSSRTTLSRELSYVADKPVFYIEELRTDLQRDTPVAV